MKVIFLDRDGIINVERGDYTWEIDQFQFTTNLFSFLKERQSEGYQFIVITNQGGINKGLYTRAQVEKLHAWMKSVLRNAGINLLDVFYCPHHSDFQKCLCRKPNAQMLEKAVAIYGVEKAQSFMIGDSQRDVDAAEKTGIRGVLLKSNPDWSNVNIPL